MVDLMDLLRDVLVCSLQVWMLNDFGKNMFPYRVGSLWKRIGVYFAAALCIFIANHMGTTLFNITIIPVSYTIAAIIIFQGSKWKKVIMACCYYMLAIIPEFLFAAITEAYGVKEYVNDKKLTIEKFQYNEDIEQRIYKTGDRGVCVEGCIWYLGREDTQIKRRGYRIELGEIESILNSVTGIKASKVVYKDSQLLAFVVPEQDFSWEISDIETIIKGKLPQFNLPDSITILERFPENINGKIDMAKLCDYANNKIETKERLENNIEKQIAEVWRRILGLKETIIYDVDFFQCGGNSLKAVEVIAEINHLFQGLELEIKDLFLNSTIKKISLKVEDELKKFMIVEEGTI